jgi:hypothetical protein
LEKKFLKARRFSSSCCVVAMVEYGIGIRSTGGVEESQLPEYPCHGHEGRQRQGSLVPRGCLLCPVPLQPALGSLIREVARVRLLMRSRVRAR